MPGIETAVLISYRGLPLLWHQPADASGGAIPDQRSFWEAIWAHREDLAGIAHTHPWDGAAHPSHEDITTFLGVEAGLGRALHWWVVTFTDVCHIHREPPEDLNGVWGLQVLPKSHQGLWVAQLREYSRGRLPDDANDRVIAAGRARAFSPAEFLCVRSDLEEKYGGRNLADLAVFHEIDPADFGDNG